MAQLAKGETFTAVSPGNVVDDTRLNNHVDGAILLNGAILDQVEKVITVAADTVLLGDSTVAASGVPKKVQLTNLLPEAIRLGVQQYGTEAAGTDAYVVTLSPLPTVLTEGMVVRFKAQVANTGAATLSLVTATTPTTAKAIVTPAGDALATGDIVAGQLCECVYNGTAFVLQTPRSQRLSKEIFGTGGGTANAHTVTLSPVIATLVAGHTVRYVATATNTGAATLAVDSTGAIAFKKIVAGAAVALLANDLQTGDVVTATYDGTQWILDKLVRSWDYVGAAAAVPATSAVANFAHGLGARPTKVRAVLVNTSTEAGYAAGDEVELYGVSSTIDFSPTLAVFADATNVGISRENTHSLRLVPKAGGAMATLTDAKWNVKVYASL